jgi:GT2 family glycosyltransferase
VPAAPVSAVIVCSFEPPEAVRGTVETLLGQTRPPAEILVVDNHPDAVVSSALVAAGLPVRPLVTGENLGYPQACNHAAPHATQPWLFFLNPDAQAAPDCLERLLDEADDDVALLGAQVLLPDGTVNAGDNPVHLVGLSWSGRYLEPREDGPARDVASVSGAASLIRTEVFRALRGHSPGFFLYVDDVDIAWRVWLAGRRVRFVPAAVVSHDYEFVKGAHKWFHLEHNRHWLVLANYRLATLVLLAPLLIAAEAGIALLARRDGWWPEKVRAWRAVWAERGRIRAWRRFVQSGRRCGDREIVARMTSSLATPLVDAPAGPAEPALAVYRRAVLAVLDGLE